VACLTDDLIGVERIDIVDAVASDDPFAAHQISKLCHRLPLLRRYGGSTPGVRPASLNIWRVVTASHGMLSPMTDSDYFITFLYISAALCRSGHQ
jgi:hypothetical protein